MKVVGLSGIAIVGLLLSYFLPNEHVTVFEPDIEQPGNVNISQSKVNISSSVWCTGSNSSDRLCVFKNLCFDSEIKDFLFFHNDLSIMFGVPGDRFDPALAELSSVENHNAQFFHYTDLPSRQHLRKDVVFIDTPTLLFNRFHPENIMHVFHDDLLPLYSTLGMICKTHYDKAHCNISTIFLDGNTWGPFSFLYKALFNEALLIQEFIDVPLYCFKEAYVGVNKQTTWYQYGFKVPQGPIHLTSSSDSLSKHMTIFRQYFSKTFETNISANHNTQYCAIILSRKTNRIILNIAEISLLISNLTRCKVKLLNLEEFNLLDIIFYITHAKIVVGMHGSLLILALFLQPNSILVELFPYAVTPSHYTPYKTLSNLPGMRLVYGAWQNRKIENTIPHPENPPNNGGISHLPLKEQKIILNSHEVPPHLCCNNVEWLFRIYQDTFVDVESFQTVLKFALERQEQSDIANHGKDDNGLKLYPTKVAQASCQIFEDKLNVEWQQPWNLAFWKPDIIEYELWIQNSASEDVKAYILRATSHEFRNIDLNVDYLMWVRCIADKKPGPFINAVKCIG